jgi:hypothetical protein
MDRDLSSEALGEGEYGETGRLWKNHMEKTMAAKDRDICEGNG